MDCFEGNKPKVSFRQGSHQTLSPGFTTHCWVLGLLLTSQMKLIAFISWGCLRSPGDKGSESPLGPHDRVALVIILRGGAWLGSFLCSWEGDFVKGGWVLFQTASLSGGRAAFTLWEPSCSVPLFRTRTHSSISAPSPAAHGDPWGGPGVW